MKSSLLIICIFLLGRQTTLAQPGYELLKDVNKIDIPFEFRNNLILVRVTFARIFPLQFIFDTGAENSILSKKSVTDALGIPYEREFKILGSDLKTELTAYLIRGIHLNIENMVAPNHSMLVLQEDYFNFEEMIGIQVDGILGADLFRGLVVKINYERKIITLTKSKEGKKLIGETKSLPILIEKNKPYLQTAIRTKSDSLVNVKLLLDTGAMLSLLLNSDTHPDLKPPANTVQGNIGAGLGGFITGHLGRVTTLHLGEFECNDVITNFQSVTIGMDTIKMQGRNGIIGNEVLSRFLVIIDYPGQKLYLTPNRRYNAEFEFDKSGLVIIATEQGLKNYVVHYVIEGSPADVAGILTGDVIKRINRSPASLLTLERMSQILKKKEGKLTKVVVEREGKRLKFEFTLRNLI
jgi:hypothetical protein